MWKTIFGWVGDGEGDFGDESSTLCLFCLYSYYYYISYTSDHQALDLRVGDPWSIVLIPYIDSMLEEEGGLNVIVKIFF